MHPFQMLQINTCRLLHQHMLARVQRLFYIIQILIHMPLDHHRRRLAVEQVFYRFKKWDFQPVLFPFLLISTNDFCIRVMHPHQLKLLRPRRRLFHMHRRMAVPSPQKYELQHTTLLTI